MTLAKRRKLALETGENFPSTVVGNRAIDNDVMDYNLGHLQATELLTMMLWAII